MILLLDCSQMRARNGAEELPLAREEEETRRAKIERRPGFPPTASCSAKNRALARATTAGCSSGDDTSLSLGYSHRRLDSNRGSGGLGDHSRPVWVTSSFKARSLSARTDSRLASVSSEPRRRPNNALMPLQSRIVRVRSTF
jgi:hypothetical protein